MTTPQSVTTWIGQLKAGEAEAAQRLWECYFARLVTLARQHLRGLPRRVSDEEDVALSAFRSFCEAVGLQRFPRLNNREDLWQLLIMLTARKAAAQRRYHQRRKRGGQPGAAGARQLEGQSAEALLAEVIGSEPDPLFAAEVAEEFERLLAALDDAELSSIAVLRLEGYTAEEIAQKADLSLRTVGRKLALIRRTWEEAGLG